MQTKQIQDVLLCFPCLADVTLEDWHEEGLTIESAPVNFTLYEGELLEKIALILDGSVRIYKLGKNGRELTLFRVKNGECCPLMASSILGETEYEASACIEKPTTFLLIPDHIYLKWILRYPKFRQFIFKSFARRLINMSNVIENIYFKSIHTRICEYIIANTTNEDESLNITHDTLSIEIGTAREVISRTLKVMEQKGLFRLKRGKITDIQRHQLIEQIREQC